MIWISCRNQLRARLDWWWSLTIPLLLIASLLLFFRSTVQSVPNLWTGWQHSFTTLPHHGLNAAVIPRRAVRFQLPDSRSTSLPRHRTVVADERHASNADELHADGERPSTEGWNITRAFPAAPSGDSEQPYSDRLTLILPIHLKLLFVIIFSKMPNIHITYTT